ncbi:MAG: hypothetical protein U1E26_06260 [Coriobacteriia bacterium]|nr:hypothetical protein [Coriobacteriia bacterium]
MTDQGPYRPPPGYVEPTEPGAPAPPPPNPAAPQGYTQSPQPGYAPTPPPAKKRNTGVIIAVVLAVIACMVVACIGTVVISVFGDQANTRKAVESAEAHLDEATAELEASTADLSAFLEDGNSDSEAKVSQQMRATRDDLAAARAVIEPLEESEGRTAYLGSLDAATEAVDGVETILGTVSVIMRLSGEVERGGKSIGVGNEALDSAITAANRKDFTTMKAKARAAARAYAAGITIFTAADKLEPEAGLLEVVAYAKLRKQQAEIIVKMADEGRAGRLSSYNKLVEQQAALDSKAEKTGTPAIVSDPTWAEGRVAEQQKAIEEAANRADELRKQALKAFGFAE